MSPQAGWYADPSDPAAVRWWDGAQWSDQTRPVPRELAMAGASAHTSSVSVVPSPSSAPTPAPAPAPTQPTTPALAPMTPVAVPDQAPHAAAAPAEAVQPAPQIAVDRSRPPTRTMAATPPAPMTTPTAPPPAPMSTPPPTPAPAATTTPPWVDAAASSGPSLNQFGTPVSGGARSATTPAGFGAAPAAGHPKGAGPERHWGKIITILVLVVAVIGGGVAFGLPRYLTMRDQGVAASQPDVLARSAPATLAGAKRAPRADPRAKAAATSATSQGASWAWSGSYGTRSAMTSYVASDVPVATRAEAVRALGSRAAAQQLTSGLATATVAAGAGIVMGVATEYASPVGGKTWCLPVTSGGISGGFCVWTNGKEMLQVLTMPGVEQGAAKSSLASLAQLAQISTKKSAS